MHDVAPTLDRGGQMARDEQGRPIDPIDVLRQRCMEIESGGVLVLSSKAYPDGRPLYDYQPTQGQQESSPLERRRELLDSAALRALGIPERALTQQGASGSYALADAHLSVLYRTCEGILSQIASSFQKYVIDKGVALNYEGDDRPTLTLITPPIGDRRKDVVIDLVRQILGSSTLSPLITNGTLDVAKLFQLADLPAGEVRPDDSADALSPSFESPQ